MIRIITNTTYGFNNGKYIEPKTKDSEPFSVRAEREAELVAAGIAEYVGEPEKEPINDTISEPIEADIEFTEEALGEKTMNELREIAKTIGVKQKAGMKKADLIDAILADDVPELDPSGAIV